MVKAEKGLEVQKKMVNLGSHSKTRSFRVGEQTGDDDLVV